MQVLEDHMRDLIIVLDKDPDYGTRLAAALHIHLSGWRTLTAATISQLPERWQDEAIICLYQAAATWPGLTDDPGMLAGCFLISLPDRASAENSLYRLMPLSGLLPQIRQFLPDIPEERPADLPIPPAGNSVPMNRREIGLVVGLEQTGHLEWLRHTIQASLHEGCQVIYLPLMPTYRMDLLTEPGRGPNLSALLLRLANNDGVERSELGHYLQPHPDGFLQFRPPERSDDLMCCEPDLLRQVVSLLRQKVQEGQDAIVVLVDCAAMPLATICNLAVLCDFCAVWLPITNGFAAEAARREISLLLARLPPGCRIEEISHAEKRP
jgi:hypothetical protein